MTVDEVERLYGKESARSYQAKSETEKERRGGHEVKQAVNAGMRHDACADERAEHRGELAHQDESAAYRHHPIGRYPVMRVVG